MRCGNHINGAPWITFFNGNEVVCLNVFKYILVIVTHELFQCGALLSNRGACNCNGTFRGQIYPENRCSTTDKCQFLIATCLGHHSQRKHRLICIKITIINHQAVLGLWWGLFYPWDRVFLVNRRPVFFHQNGGGLATPRNSTGHG